MRLETIKLSEIKIGERFRKEYGDMGVDQAKRLKELDQENSRPKKLVADITLDNVILKEAARGNF